MDLRVFALLIFNTAVVAFHLSQEQFCDSEFVVKAKILPEGYIQRKTARGVKKERPVLGNHERLYEIQIKDVFKGALGTQLVDSLHYAKSKHPDDINYDADGCQFYQENEPALFHFDNLNNITIKRYCKGWKVVPEFERNTLKKRNYDCNCDLETCYNRHTYKTGIPSLCNEDSKQWGQILCTWDYKRSRCVWKGAKSITCLKNETLSAPPGNARRRN
ncbi:hypothetical protein ACHWQZ_G012441 [Mnemiopsis leidyi]